MRNTIPLFITIAILAGFLNPNFAQVKGFTFKSTDSTLYKYPLKSIRVNDARADKKNIGFIKKGLFGVPAPVIMKGPLDDQLTEYIQSLCKPDANGRELFLNIRQFNFLEIKQNGLQHGYFRLRAEIYQNQNEGYKRLGQIDTALLISAMDATPKMYKAANQTINDWLLDISENPPMDNTLWTMDKMLKVDQFEKSKIPLFRPKSLPEGLYNSYGSLATLTPDKSEIEITYDEANDKIMAFKKEEGALVPIKITDKMGYAIILNNKLWVLTPNGYSRVYADNGNLYFKVQYEILQSSNAMSPLFMFGVAGGAIAVATAEKTFEYFTYLIDHLNGAFLPISKGKL